MKTQNVMWKPQKMTSSKAILLRERWIYLNQESYTPKMEITLTYLKEKQWHGNTLLK